MNKLNEKELKDCVGGAPVYAAFLTLTNANQNTVGIPLKALQPGGLDTGILNGSTHISPVGAEANVIPIV